MNYLALSQEVAFKSGTVSSASLPSAVTGQTGRLAQIVDYVDTSWQSIQTMRPDWRWMRTEFTGAVLSPTQRWSATDFSITRFSRWVFDPRPGYSSGFSIYLTATGVSDEQPLSYMEWPEFRRQFLMGAQTAERPVWFTIDNEDQIVLGPAPDDDYTINGEYQKSPQALTANTDTPECPTENHWLIVWDALVMLAENDEAVPQEPRWRLRRDAELGKLESTQLPRPGLGLAYALA